MTLGSGRKSVSEWKEVSSVQNKVKCVHFWIEVSVKTEIVKIHLNKCLKRRTNSTHIQSQNDASLH